MRHFVDQSKITIKAGDGGDGIVSFRRERYVPKGGPDGGDGGDGGNVYFIGDNNLSTLLDFQQKRNFKAQPGERGGKSNMTGASGEDLYLRVPVGTMIFVFDEESDENQFIADIQANGQVALVARGGEGGKGNTRFKSSTNQAPKEFTPGTPGQEKAVTLELKLIADIGLIGYPNAGKSTLLSVMTNAKPEIAGYRFTTLQPNLGVMQVYDRELVIADIPGLIEGAAEGKGLGDDFLRHVERTRVLVHLIDPLSAATEQGMELSAQAVLNAYQIIRDELSDYSAILTEKPELVVITKLDISENEQLFEKTAELFKKEGIETVGISAATHMNLDTLQQKMVALVEEAPEMETPESPAPVFGIEDL
ncbi:GTPase ObgE [candidate division WWE3 bacterium]|uniref:GTPase Obg n=1 Tax=candidate division WWE3 bacterium TaxID=2053526 RepID=A0A955LIH7_UNCKA|nr:GTPase ObgE [candidate division WWE3 bacterium]